MEHIDYWATQVWVHLHKMGFFPNKYYRATGYVVVELQVRGPTWDWASSESGLPGGPWS